jgi:RimJ/RimL family protein N-acetyltransferase
MKTPRIDSERLVLDALTSDDAEAVFRYCQDAELQRWVPIPVPYDRASAEFFTGPYSLDAATSKSFTLWAIRASGALVGAIELRHEELGSASVGYWLGHEHRGRGIMTEALGILIEYAFDEAGFALQRMHWQAVVGNYASGIVARRNGFTFEGTGRGALPFRGKRVDAWQATLLADDSRDPVDGWPL